MKRLAILFLMLAACDAFAGEAPAPADAKSARARIVELAKKADSANGASMKELLTAYLALQEFRLLGRDQPDDGDHDPRKVLEARLAERGKNPDPWTHEEQLVFKALQRAADYRAHAPLDAGDAAALENWFKASPQARERLLFCLDPVRDCMPEAAKVALKIRGTYPQEAEELDQLMLAFACVWDDPSVPTYNHTRIIPELREDYKAPDPTDSFGWFVENKAKLNPWMKDAPWQLLVYVAADATELADRYWASDNFKFDPLLGRCYERIVYDDSKLVDNIGKLGGKPYTLENLKTYGGVCRDQAYFARSVCRANGIPAYVACGQGNASIRHAWIGWVVKDGRGYRIEDFGRYSYDNYFLAKVMSPKTGEESTDYAIALQVKALQDEKGYADAELLFRVATEFEHELTPDEANRLLAGAVTRNPCHRTAWLALARAAADGRFSVADAGKQWVFLNRHCAAYPDLTFDLLNSFACVYKDAAQQYQFFETASRIYLQAKRLDLVARLRMQEMDMCERFDRKDMALGVATKATLECAGEGSQGAEIALRCGKLATELKRPKDAILPMKNTLARMPKTRSEFINPYYVKVAYALADVYRAAGDDQGARAVESQIPAEARR